MSAHRQEARLEVTDLHGRWVDDQGQKIETINSASGTLKACFCGTNGDSWSVPVRVSLVEKQHQIVCGRFWLTSATRDKSLITQVKWKGIRSEWANCEVPTRLWTRDLTKPIRTAAVASQRANVSMSSNSESPGVAVNAHGQQKTGDTTLGDFLLANAKPMRRKKNPSGPAPKSSPQGKISRSKKQDLLEEMALESFLLGGDVVKDEESAEGATGPSLPCEAGYGASLAMVDAIDVPSSDVFLYPSSLSDTPPKGSPPHDVEEATPSSADASQPRVRNIRKKLKEIDNLETKQNAGIMLSPEQLQKLSRKQRLVLELQEVEGGSALSAESITGQCRPRSEGQVEVELHEVLLPYETSVSGYLNASVGESVSVKFWQGPDEWSSSGWCWAEITSDPNRRGWLPQSCLYGAGRK